MYSPSLLSGTAHSDRTRVSAVSDIDSPREAHPLEDGERSLELSERRPGPCPIRARDRVRGPDRQRVGGRRVDAHSLQRCHQHVESLMPSHGDEDVGKAVGAGRREHALREGEGLGALAAERGVRHRDLFDQPGRIHRALVRRVGNQQGRLSGYTAAGERRGPEPGPVGPGRVSVWQEQQLGQDLAGVEHDSVERARLRVPCHERRGRRAIQSADTRQSILERDLGQALLRAGGGKPQRERLGRRLEVGHGVVQVRQAAAVLLEHVCDECGRLRDRRAGEMLPERHGGVSARDIDAALRDVHAAAVRREEWWPAPGRSTAARASGDAATKARVGSSIEQRP